jgi:general stress protein 26
MAEATDTEDRLYDVIKGFDTAILVTRAADGSSHARPMRIAEIRRGGDILFATNTQSPKTDEIAANSEVLVTFQGRLQFATVSGTAAVIRDPALVEKLWSEAWNIWFPGGKDDPTLAFVRVTARSGEYWDSAGAQGIKYAYEATKAYMQGKTPVLDEKQHAKVRR